VTTSTPAEPQERPEPVLDVVQLGARAGAVVTAIGGLVVILAGGIAADEWNPLALAVSALVVAGVALYGYVAAMRAGRVARAAVTPLAAPQDSDGNPLVAMTELSAVGTVVNGTYTGELPGLVQHVDPVTGRPIGEPTSVLGGSDDDGEHRYPGTA